MSTTLTVVLSEENLQEIFALFSSATNEEKDMVYDPSHRLFFKNERLDEEYHLTQEKREFAIDAWRAVTYFLYRQGYKISKGGGECDLASSSQYSP